MDMCHVVLYIYTVVTPDFLLQIDAYSSDAKKIYGSRQTPMLVVLWGQHAKI